MIVDYNSNKTSNTNITNEKEILFSCIMAIYNIDKYLEEAILSIINQTLDFKKYIQLILVNDGSTDKSAEICLKYEKLYPDNIVYIYKKNGGVSSARNVGLKYANGEYVNFIDGDDYFSKNALNVVNCFFNKNYRQVNAATIEMIDFSDKDIGQKSYYHQFYTDNQIIDFSRIYNFAVFNPGMIFLKRSCIEKYQFNENIKIGEDVLYLYSFFIDNPKCGAIKNEKYMHRIREGSATTSKRKYEDTYKLLNIVLMNLLEYSKNQNGNVQQFIIELSLNIIMQEIVKRLPDYDRKQQEILIEEMKKSMALISNSSIENAIFIDSTHKKILLRAKEKTVDSFLNSIKKPLVSIIIPAYNAEKYLREAIDSALNQTYKNIEIIVVNDGSTDKTDEIAKSYGNKIRYFSKENGGVSTALNLAISKMKGEYFSWLSHDDRYYPNKVESQINYLKSMDSIDNIILYSDYDLMNNNSKVYATSIKDHKTLVENPEYALLRAEINGITLLIPKKAFDEFGLFDENLRCVQDYELWKRMQKKYVFLHQEGVLATTRIHEKQQGNTNPKMLAEGEPFWTNLFITDTPLETKIKLSDSEYNFYKEMANLFISTPYKQTVKTLNNKMEEIKKHVKKVCSNIKVSVIIPFYNRSNVLINAINSVLDQTHQNFELILVDDGSTDNLDNIFELIKNNSKIKYVKLDKNIGASHARNIGIKNSSGQYIAFLDSDDTFLPEKIEMQLNEMVLGGYKFSHTSYIRKSADSTEQVMNSGNLTGVPIPRIIASCGIATPTVMIERDYLIKNDFYYDEDLEIGEDICFYLKILQNIRILGINIPLSIVNTNFFSAALNNEKQLIGLQTIIKYILNDKAYSQYHYEISLLFNQYIGIASDLLVNSDFCLPECANCKRLKASLSWRITKPVRFIGRCKNYINRTHYNNFKHDLKTYGVKYVLKKFIGKFHN